MSYERSDRQLPRASAATYGIISFYAVDREQGTKGCTYYLREVRRQKMYGDRGLVVRYDNSHFILHNVRRFKALIAELRKHAEGRVVYGSDYVNKKTLPLPFIKLYERGNESWPAPI